jgi:hypothetical protein
MRRLSVIPSLFANSFVTPLRFLLNVQLVRLAKSLGRFALFIKKRRDGSSPSLGGFRFKWVFGNTRGLVFLRGLGSLGLYVY